jgi:hypothetical protein
VFSLRFLPGLTLQLHTDDALPQPPSYWPRAKPEGGFSVGASLHVAALGAAISSPAHLDRDFQPLEPREANLGSFRVLQSDPLKVECLVGSPPIRALDTAIRLCTLLWVSAHDGILLHATALSNGRSAVIGIAPSGGGKSTLTDLAQASGIVSLSDETVAILPDPASASGYAVWGTPFRSSSVQVPAIEKSPLSALLLLEKSIQPHLIPADVQHSLRTMMQQAYSVVGTSPEVFRRSAKIAKGTSAFRFQFPKSLEAARLLDEAFEASLA